MTKDYESTMDRKQTPAYTEELPSPCFSVLRLKQDNEPNSPMYERFSIFKSKRDQS